MFVGEGSVLAIVSLSVHVGSWTALYSTHGQCIHYWIETSQVLCVFGCVYVWEQSLLSLLLWRIQGVGLSSSA